MIRLTKTAENRIFSLMKSAPEGSVAFHIKIRERGCTGLSYVFNYINEYSNGDEIITLSNGCKVVIDSKSCLYLIGSELDYIEEELSSRFIFKNPNAKGYCGCGESFRI
ncbi:HesB/IscA family protein [Lyticum sinuosum]|uniref:Iron-binding protein IscA n=1 Tax=Lyticum sinuosum TaxID=1332059 RepID=A0AAE4VK95_9RICK|nr:iron-sulfur cluster assembly accessory protein [Lyticum sinuosum]MDZ5761530.1 Iron-binding protein IscA [Lyticum sinuosum]